MVPLVAALAYFSCSFVILPLVQWIRRVWVESSREWREYLKRPPASNGIGNEDVTLKDFVKRTDEVPRLSDDAASAPPPYRL